MSRLSTTTIAESTSRKLADINTTTVSEQQLTPSQAEAKKEAEVQAVVSVTEGIQVGAQRKPDEDQAVFQKQVQVASAIQSAQRTVAAALSEPATTEISSRISPVPEDRIAQASTKTYVSKKTQADITRASQNLQRRCNHQYNLTTKRCNFCNKHRDSHVYDQ